MKKALVLGVLAFFAINIATVQNVNAQGKKKVTTKEAVEVKNDNNDKKEAKATATEKKTSITKAASSSIQQERKDVKTERKNAKTEKKDVKTEKKEVVSDQKNVKPQSSEADPTQKNNNLNRTATPKPKVTKESNTANGNTPTSR